MAQPIIDVTGKAVGPIQETVTGDGRACRFHLDYGSGWADIYVFGEGYAKLCQQAIQPGQKLQIVGRLYQSEDLLSVRASVVRFLWPAKKTRP